MLDRKFRLRWGASIPVTIELNGALDKAREILKNRTIGLMLQGKSIVELETRVSELKGANICWTAMNRFDIYQTNILDKMGKELEIVMDVGEVT